MSEPAIDIHQSAYDLNLERGIRLSHIVGRAFSVVVGLEWLIYVVLTLPVRWSVLFLTLGLLGAVLMLWQGVRLARRRQGEWAARSIVVGILVATATFQFAWAYGHGIDAIVIILMLAQMIPIGLSSVLSGVVLLQYITASSIGISGILFLGGAFWFTPHLAFPLALSTWILASLLSTIIALLLFGASVLYDQVLFDLGALRIAYERAKQLDLLKDQFITNVNHELRTPIMTMQGTIEFLQAARHTMPPAQETLLFAQATRNADRLVTLLSRILDVRQIEREGVAVDAGAVVLHDVVDAARQIVDPLGERRILMYLSPKTMMWADAQLLQQVVVNVLSNAMKYSPPESRIEVSAGEIAEKGIPATMQLRIRDFGLGIPPEQIPLLFHRFVRLPRDLASQVVGSGVGLYLCNVLMEAMGGRIWVESSGVSGDGSTFIMELPAVEAKFATTAIRPKLRQRKR